MIDVAAVVVDIDFMLENSPVFQAQVGEQLLTLARAGYRTALIGTFRDRARFHAALGQRLAAAGVEVRLVRHGGLAGNLWRVAAAVRNLHRDAGIRRAYVRGIWGRVALRLGVPVPPIPYVYDVRGALGDETRAKGSAAAKASVFRALERNAVRHAAAVTAVSAPLADILKRDYGRTDVRVIPSCVSVDSLRVADADRRSERTQLGFAPADIVLTYCGGIDYYQRIPEMLQLWESLLDEPDVRFLLITNDAPSLAGALGDVDRFGPRMVRRSVPRADVPRVLAAGDIGFMLRDARTMNAAASPVKFAEYLAAGLAVVTSPGVGDPSGLVRARELGALVDPSRLAEGIPDVRQLVSAVRRDRERFRRGALALARERYDWTAHLPTFRRMYGDAPLQSCAAS
jgi:glycosyltransferase involved in cell wall biosynthesis